MPATLGIIDLDFFKKINDTYGHITGDMVIVIVSRLLEQRLRCGDIVGRVGGEEFAFIMQNTTPQEAYTVIESVRCTFGKIVHEAPAGSFTATFSCGLAALQTANDPAQWYDAADSALYKAKKQGRNRTCIAQVQRKQKYEVQL